VELVRAVVLGVVQGVTEFLPVSSSGHLILVPELFGWPDQGLAFDAALHAGTLLALLLYFHRTWVELAAGAARDLTGLRPGRLREPSPESRLLALLLLGSVPAAVVGLLLDDWIEAHLRQAWVVAATLAGVGALLWWVEGRPRGERGVPELGPRDALLIGCLQAAALVPGVSRSGATILAGLLLGMPREEAARFAFLLGTPAFAGAFLLKAPDLANGDTTMAAVVVGMTTSALVGAATVAWLLRYLVRGSLRPFAAYRGVLALLVLLVVGLR